MLGRPPIDLPPPAVEVLNREGLDEAAAVACLAGAKEAREDEAPTPRELRDALDTVASVVRLRAAMLASLSLLPPLQVKRNAKSKLFSFGEHPNPSPVLNASTAEGPLSEYV